ncbi:MAG: hypothetical protein C0425_10705 [Chlorobiaceae bacterium]|nr:hypothetical protein [Chlorobiaceae bacterium]MBA4310786.1 hypothetical protein [Chlorobiaceae bacterium]
MGDIIFWAIIRTAILIPVLWIAKDFIDYSFWWTLTILCIYGVILHPALIQYRLFLEKNNVVLNSTLCSSCQHFDKTAVLCLKHDEHPTEIYLPCDGLEWEPQSNEQVEEKDFL